MTLKLLIARNIIENNIVLGNLNIEILAREEVVFTDLVMRYELYED